MGHETYHEPLELLSEDTRNMHRALVSLQEELEAVDWYQQRADACNDGELRAVLVHNKNEEIEHAIMTLEWIRRHSPVFDANIRTYINASGPITEVEKNEKEGGGEASSPKSGASKSSGTSKSGDSLGIGSLKRPPSSTQPKGR